MAKPVQPLDAIAVVVPVCDEEQLLAASLDHIRTAMDRLGSAGRCAARLVVVLDACSDGSADIASAAAATDSRIRIVVTDGRSVGAARALGVRTALAGIPPSCLPRLWIANTDADTRVPPDWLERFAEAADAGADAVMGTVEPDVLELGRPRYAAWQALHLHEDGHQHVHGANLGVRASAYCEAGGFSQVAGDEDVQLVEAMRARGADVRASGKLHVVTSGRLQGRVRHGFADYLARLPDTEPDGENALRGWTQFVDSAGGRT